MKTELNKRHDDISGLLDLPENSYEQIFNMYKDENHFAYNIIKTVRIPENLDPDMFFYTRVSGRMNWTQISFEHYGSINLWWLICLVNGIQNPVSVPAPGLVIKIINREYVKDIMGQIQTQL